MLNIAFKKFNRKAFYDRNSSSWQYLWDTKINNKKKIKHRRTHLVLTLNVAKPATEKKLPLVFSAAKTLCRP